MKHVLFIGAGEIGTALAFAIKNQATVEMWDKDPERAPNMRSLEDSVPEADVIFICVPSWVVREVLGTIVSKMNDKTVVVSLAKGIEEKTLKTMDAVLEELLPTDQRFGVLGGPLIAEELMLGLPGVGVFASKSESAFKEIAPLFAGSAVRTEYLDDPRGVALAAVLKNIFAVGLGMADGLGWGWNGKGWLATRSIQEIGKIIEILGGGPGVALGSAGLGDFLATAMSPNSRNHEAGREIALTGKCQSPSEGCRSISLIISLLKENVNQFPLLLALASIIVDHQDSKDIFLHL